MRIQTIRLGDVDILDEINNICTDYYPTFPDEQRERISTDIIQMLTSRKSYPLVFLEETVKVIDEFNIFLSGSPEQQHIKQLLNKKIPPILAISVFDYNTELRGDIALVGYSRLLDRISAIESIDISNNQLQRSIQKRRLIWHMAYRAVSNSEFRNAIKMI